MTRLRVLIAAGVSVALLGGAYVFEYFGYAPCTMCYWQRWPHMAAIGIGAVALALPAAVLGLLGALAALTTAGIGIYHTGVERGFWEGPSSCTGGGGLDGLSGGDLLSLDGPRLIMCDQVSWEMLGLSMASWNAVFSLVAVWLWLVAARSLRT
ncbi:MAG: disulfide bond formation protein B [Pseudomonadota bacterium]